MFLNRESEWARYKQVQSGVRYKPAMPSALTYRTLNLPDSKQPLVGLIGGLSLGYH